MPGEVKQTNFDLVTLLETCRDIETYCAELYHVYADHFADDPEMKQLWEKTYKEEENHARQFVLALNMRKENVVTAMNIDKTKALQVLNMVKGIYSSIIGHPPSKIDALRSAINLEKKLAEFHLTLSGSFGERSMEEMFRAMMLADDDHVETLQRAYAKALGK